MLPLQRSLVLALSLALGGQILAQSVDTGNLGKLGLLKWEPVQGEWKPSGTHIIFDPTVAGVDKGTRLPPGAGLTVCANARYVVGRVAVRVRFSGTPNTAQIIFGYSHRSGTYFGVGIDENRAVVIHHVTGKGTPPERRVINAVHVVENGFKSGRDYRMDLHLRSKKSATGDTVVAYEFSVNDIGILQGELADPPENDTVGLVARSDKAVDFEVLDLESAALLTR